MENTVYNIQNLEKEIRVIQKKRNKMRTFLTNLIVEYVKNENYEMSDKELGKFLKNYNSFMEILREDLMLIDGDFVLGKIDKELSNAASRKGYSELVEGEHKVERQWYAYVMDESIDYNWEFLKTVSEIQKDMERIGFMTHQERHQQMEQYKDDWEKAVSLAKVVGWDNNFRQEPCVFWLPSGGEFSYAFVLKSENNGTTYVVSPLSLDWIENSTYRNEFATDIFTFIHSSDHLPGKTYIKKLKDDDIPY